MNYLPHNLNSLLEIIRRKTPGFSKTDMAKLLGWSRVSFYKYMEKDMPDEKLLQTAATGINHHLGIDISSDDLTYRDLSSIFDRAIPFDDAREEYHPDMERLIERLYYLRGSKDMTYKDVQKRSYSLFPRRRDPRRISDVYVFTIERGGVKTIGWHKLMGLAMIYEIEPEELFRLAGLLPKQVAVSRKKLIFNINENYPVNPDDLENQIREVIEKQFPGLLK